MVVLQFLAGKWFVSVFLLAGSWFCGFGYGKVKGWKEYEQIEEESKVW
jgi:hypothetical protein